MIEKKAAAARLTTPKTNLRRLKYQNFYVVSTPVVKVFPRVREIPSRPANRIVLNGGGADGKS